MEKHVFKLDNYFDLEVQCTDTGIILMIVNENSKIVEQKYLNVRELESIILTTYLFQ